MEQNKNTKKNTANIIRLCRVVFGIVSMVSVTDIYACFLHQLFSFRSKRFALYATVARYYTNNIDNHFWNYRVFFNHFWLQHKKTVFASYVCSTVLEKNCCNLHIHICMHVCDSLEWSKNKKTKTKMRNKNGVLFELLGVFVPIAYLFLNKFIHIWDKQRFLSTVWFRFEPRQQFDTVDVTDSIITHVC